MEQGLNGRGVPVVAELIAATFLPDDAQREAMLGDLAEEYQLLAAQQDARAAGRWYWSHVIRSIVPLAIMTIHAEGWSRFVGNMMAGLIAIVILVPLSFSGAGWAAAFAVGGEYIDGVLAFGRAPYVVYSWWALTGIVIGLGVGYTLARIGGTSGVVSAIAVGLVCVPLSAITIAADGGGAQVWFEVALSAVILPAIALGTLAADRRHTHPAARGIPSC